MLVFELGHAQGLPHARQVDRLSARHATAAAGRREELQHFQLNRGIVAQAVLREQMERERLQAVAREERGRHVEFDVAGRLAAPEHVVVHARKVVVNERIGVDAFDRARRDLEPARVGARRLARGEREQGPYALASSEHRVAHGLVEAPRRNARRGQSTFQRRFDPGLDSRHPGGEITRCRHRGGFSAYFLRAPSPAAAPGRGCPGSIARALGPACARRETAPESAFRTPCWRRSFPARRGPPRSSRADRSLGAWWSWGIGKIAYGGKAVKSHRPVQEIAGAPKEKGLESRAFYLPTQGVLSKRYVRFTRLA